MNSAREISSRDAALLSADLAATRTIAIEAPAYAGGRGLIEYRETGIRGKPVIVLLHGLGSSSAGYRAQLTGLADCFNVLAWNAPGYGQSTGFAKGDPTVEDYVAVLAAFLVASRIDRITCLVGSSWGSVIAVAYARQYPAALASLLLSAPNKGRGNLSAAERERELKSMPAQTDFENADRSAVTERLLPTDAPIMVRQLVERLRDAVTYAGWSRGMKMMFSAYTPDLIADLRIPITIVVGKRDRMAPLEQHGLVLHAAAPTAEMLLLDGCGHMAKLEMPAGVNDALSELARRVARNET